MSCHGAVDRAALFKAETAWTTGAEADYAHFEAGPAKRRVSHWSGSCGANQRSHEAFVISHVLKRRNLIVEPVERAGQGSQTRLRCEGRRAPSSTRL